MTERHALPMRRRAETFEIAFGGLNGGYVVTAGFFDSGGVGEIFISGGKSGQQIEAAARDAAILLSLCLQHGVVLDTVAHALTRDERNEPLSVIGAAVDKLLKDG